MLFLLPPPHQRALLQAMLLPHVAPCGWHLLLTPTSLLSLPYLTDEIHFVCMCVWWGVHMCTWVFMPLCVSAQGVFMASCLVSFESLSLKLEHVNRLSWPATEPQGFSCP